MAIPAQFAQQVFQSGDVLLSWLVRQAGIV
jgi:hypothetical protein